MRVEYKLTHKILNNIIKFEKYKTLIETHPNLKESNIEEIEKEKKTIDLYQLSNLLSINISLREVENITKSKKPFLSDPNSKLIVSFFSAQEFINSTIKNNFSTVEINFLLQLNKLLLNSYSDIKLAKLRDSGEAVDKTHDEWSELRDLSIVSTYIRPRLAGLIDYYKQIEGKVHPIINLSIVFFYLVRICPFITENKLTTITILNYFSKLQKLTSFEYLSLNKVIESNEQKYIESWFKAINIKEELTDWIELFCETLTKEIEEVYEDLSKKLKKQNKSVDQPFLNLNPRQLKILRYLQNIPTVKREEYCEMMNVSTMTAFRDLDELVGKKLLKIIGKARGTKYTLFTR